MLQFVVVSIFIICPYKCRYQTGMCDSERTAAASSDALPELSHSNMDSKHCFRDKDKDNTKTKVYFPGSIQSTTRTGK